MPYITQEEREQLKTSRPTTPGQLNYMITKIAFEFSNRKLSSKEFQNALRDIFNMFLPAKRSYADFNAVIGAIECAKLEIERRRENLNEGFMTFVLLNRVKRAFYREIVAPYEDTKIALNGDLPEYQTQVVDTSQ